MLLFAAFGIQGDEVDIYIRLRNLLNAYVEFPGDLIGGFDIAFHANLRHGKFLPAQAARGDICQ